MKREGMISMKKIFPISCITMLLVVLLAGVIQSPAQAVKTGDIPKLKSPYGYVIDTTPAYVWVKVASATNYQLQVYTGTTLVYTKTYGNSFCGATTCRRSPADVLSLGKYKWRMRAKIDGAWKAWAAYKYFDLVEPSLSFNSNFNGSMKGWIKKAGGAWYVSDTALYTDGVANANTSIYRCTGDYTNFTYEARLRRAEGNLFNYMTVRMGNQVDPANGNIWYPGYYFGYSNNGTYSIWRFDGPTSPVSIVYGMESDEIIDGGWNTLKVVADGDYFEFWINGVRQVYFDDSTYAAGMVGFQVPQLSAPLERFEVDWSRLLVTSP
jgi:hypothetical protein